MPKEGKSRGYWEDNAPQIKRIRPNTPSMPPMPRTTNMTNGVATAIQEAILWNRGGIVAPVVCASVKMVPPHAGTREIARGKVGVGKVHLGQVGFQKKAPGKIRPSE